MNQSEIFITILSRNQESTLRAIDDLSETESVLQLPGSGNCVNWILGHIVSYRDGMLIDIGLNQYMHAEELVRYTAGSAPIKAGDICVDLERLSKLMTITFEDLAAWLNSDQNGLQQQPVGDVRDNIGYAGVCDTLTEHFAQNIGHESIHVGELNPLRELALGLRSK